MRFTFVFIFSMYYLHSNLNFFPNYFTEMFILVSVENNIFYGFNLYFVKY